EREREDRPGDGAGEGEREDHAAERSRATRTEIARGFEQAAWYALERRVDRQDHERQPHVREDDPHCLVRELELRVRQAEAVQEPVERAALGQYRRPVVDADELARSEWEQDHHE